MSRILDVDLERSILDELRERLAANRDKTAEDQATDQHALAIDEPGLMFRVKGRDRWIEPRLTEFSPQLGSVRGGSATGLPEPVVVTVRCLANSIDFIFQKYNGTIEYIDYDWINMNAGTGTIEVDDAVLRHFSRYGFVN